MLKAWICLLLIGAATMALPAATFAQSAGDDQYQDPLGGGNGSGSSGGSGNSGGGGGSTSPGSSGTAGESAQSAQAHGTASGQSNQLPRTGVPAGVLALSGATLLGAGVVLRRRVSPRTGQ
jgi:LPXTG-motif cell wall-anchored protein